MNHNHIQKYDLIDRYLMGRLTPDEREEFEEHFVDCAECVDRLAVTKDFILGFRHMASRQPMEQHAYKPRTLRWYSPRISPKWFVPAIGLLLLALIVGVSILLNRTRQSQLQAAQWERRFEEEHQSLTSADAEHQQAQREMAEQIAQLQSRLEQREHEIAGPRDRSAPPQINTPIFQLHATRGVERQSESIEKLALPRSAERFMMLAPLEGELGYTDYRITIQGERRKVIWTNNGLKPNPEGALTVLFGASFFPPGTYLVTVEGVNAAGAASVVGVYRFRV